MSLAKEINEKLDEILEYRREYDEMMEDFQDPDFTLKDVNTGKYVTKAEVLNKAISIYDQIIEDLNKLTNDGNNVRDIFTNDYYVNDRIQDKLILEEIRFNKLNTEEEKQNPNNN